MANLKFTPEEYSVLHWALHLYDQYLTLPAEKQPIPLPSMTPLEQEEAGILTRRMLDRAYKSWRRAAGF